MATLVVTFDFLNDAQSFTGTAGANSTLAWTGSFGNPAGDLQSQITGKNHTNSNHWDRTLTFETMGVPPKSVITGITSASMQSRCTTFTTGASSTSGTAVLVDGTTTVTLSSARTFSATDASFVTTNGVDSTGLTLQSADSVTITINNTLATGNSASANVTLQQDQLTFTITYTQLPTFGFTFENPRGYPYPLNLRTHTQNLLQSTLAPAPPFHRRYMNGFETGDFSECGGSGVGGSVVTSGGGDQVRTGAYSCKCASGAGAYRESTTGLNISSGFLRTYIYSTATSGKATFILGFGTSSDGRLIELKTRTDGKFDYVNETSGSTVVVGTGTTVLPLNQWVLLELKAVISAGSGIIEAKINGTVDGSFTGLTTDGLGNIDRGIWGPADNDTAATYYFDDIAIDDTSYPGAGQIIARQGKTGTPTYDAWTKNGAATATLCWSDTPFSAATNCSDAILSDAQTMLVAPFSATQTGHGTEVIGTTDTVNACKVALIAKESTAGTMKIRRRVNSTDTDTAINTTTSDAYYDDGIWTTTVANLDLLEAGAVSQSGSLTTTVEDVWAMVDYTPFQAPPFFQTDWPNPKSYPYRLRDWQQPISPIFTTLRQPFNQTDWPNPKAYPYRLRDWQQPTNPIINTLQIPFNQNDWPNPKRPYYQLRDWQQPPNSLIGFPVPAPFYQTDWPNPKGYSYRLRDWPQPPNLALTTLPGSRLTPFSQSDWPLPKTPYYQLRDWAQPANVIITVPIPAPFFQTDWPLPKAYPYRLRDWPQPPNLALTTLPGSRVTPFYQTDWPLPNRGPQRMPYYTWIQTRPFYYRDAPPFAGHRRGFPRLPRSATTYQIIDAINRLLSGESETPSPYQIDVVAENFSVNFPAAFKYLLLNPASGLTSGQVTLPIDAIDRDRLWIATTQNITTLTVLPATGQMLLNAPTSLSAGASISFVYVASSLTWFRLQ